MVCFLAILYLLPSIIGFNKKSALGIFVLNLLLGWTYIGWVIALVWAIVAEKVKKGEQNGFSK